MAQRLISVHNTLVKYDNPILVTQHEEKKLKVNMFHIIHVYNSYLFESLLGT